VLVDLSSRRMNGDICCRCLPCIQLPFRNRRQLIVQRSAGTCQVADSPHVQGREVEPFGLCNIQQFGLQNMSNEPCSTPLRQHLRDTAADVPTATAASPVHSDKSSPGPALIASCKGVTWICTNGLKGYVCATPKAPTLTPSFCLIVVKSGFCRRAVSTASNRLNCGVADGSNTGNGIDGAGRFDPPGRGCNHLHST